MKAILLVGLPASGKSHLANEMMKSGSYILFDDIYQPKDVEEALKLSNVIICDPHFCESVVFDKAQKLIWGWGHTTELIYFENNPEKALKNVEYRQKLGDHRTVKNFIKCYSPTYKIPDGYQSREIWQPPNDSTSIT